MEQPQKLVRVVVYPWNLCIPGMAPNLTPQLLLFQGYMISFVWRPSLGNQLRANEQERLLGTVVSEKGKLGEKSAMKAGAAGWSAVTIPARSGSMSDCTFARMLNERASLDML